jgi:hypothetical protein
MFFGGSITPTGLSDSKETFSFAGLAERPLKNKPAASNNETDNILFFIL